MVECDTLSSVFFCFERDLVSVNGRVDRWRFCCRATFILFGAGKTTHFHIHRFSKISVFLELDIWLAPGRCPMTIIISGAQPDRI